MLASLEVLKRESGWLTIRFISKLILVFFVQICVIVSVYAEQSFDRYYALGVDALQAGQNDTALEQLRIAHQMQPNHFGAHFHLAKSLIKTKAFEEAKQELLELSKRRLSRARRANVLRELGVTYLKLGNKQQAFDVFLEAKAIARQDAQLLHYLGVAAQSLGRYEESLEYFEQSTRVDQALDLANQYFSALTIYAQGNTAIAITRMEHVRYLSPESHFGQAAVSWIDKIEKKESAVTTDLDAVITLGGQFDTNVILEPRSVNISDGADFRGIAVMSLIGRHQPFFASYSLYQSLHTDLDTFDVQDHRLNFEYRKNLKSVPMSVGVRNILGLTLFSRSLNFFSLADYVETFTDIKINSLYQLGVVTSFQWQDFRQIDEARDNIGAGLKLKHMFNLLDKSLKTNVNMGFQYEDAGIEFDVFEFSFATNLAFSWLTVQLKPRARFDYAWYYNGTLGRKDKIIYAGISASKSFLKWLSAEASYDRIFNMSNVAAFDYTRDIVSLTVTATTDIL